MVHETTLYYGRDLTIPSSAALRNYRTFICVEDAAQWAGLTPGAIRNHVRTGSNILLNGRYTFRRTDPEQTLFPELEFCIPQKYSALEAKVTNAAGKVVNHYVNVASTAELRRIIGAKFPTQFIRLLAEICAEMPNEAFHLVAPCGDTLELTVNTPPVARFSARVNIADDSRWRRRVASILVDGVPMRMGELAYDLYCQADAHNMLDVLYDWVKPFYAGTRAGEWIIFERKIVVTLHD